MGFRFKSRRTGFTVWFPGTSTAGKNARITAPVSGKITSAYISTKDVVAAIALIIDLHKESVTMFTTQANRPTVAIGLREAISVAPDISDFAAGEEFSIIIDQVSASTEDIAVTINTDVL